MPAAAAEGRSMKSTTGSGLRHSSFVDKWESLGAGRERTAASALGEGLKTLLQPVEAAWDRAIELSDGPERTDH